MDSQNDRKLPVINFGGENLKEGTEKWSSTCKDVRRALEEYGCFMVVHDGLIPWHLRDSIISVADQLFSLPTETKVQNASNTPFFSYLGGVPEVPLYESLGIGDATSLKAIHKFCQLMWPDRNEDFCGIIHQYANLLSSVEKTAARMVFHSYGLGKLSESHVDSTTSLLRFSSYRVPQRDETTTGAKPHTDKTFLTILDQNQVSGLEVKLKDDQWCTVDFLPCSFIVMAGEGLMGWSNKRIEPPVHRVTMNGGKLTRYSMGIFSFHKGIIHIPEEFIDDEHPRRFKSFDHLGLLHFFATQFGAGGQSDLSIYAYCGV